jgi:hypothetical protein
VALERMVTAKEPMFAHSILTPSGELNSFCFAGGTRLDVALWPETEVPNYQMNV